MAVRLWQKPIRSMFSRRGPTWVEGLEIYGRSQPLSFSDRRFVAAFYFLVFGVIHHLSGCISY